MINAGEEPTCGNVEGWEGDEFLAIWR